MNSKFEIRKNYTMIKKGFTRVKTDLVEDVRDLLVISQKKLPKCLQTVTQPSEDISGEPEEPNC